MVGKGDVLAAFEILIGELGNALKETHEKVSEALAKGDYPMARNLTTQAEAIERFVGEIQAKRDRWKDLIAAKSLRRQGDSEARRISRGLATPRDSYSLPILRALVQRGGAATIGAVMDDLYREMRDRFTAADLQTIPSNPNLVRWRHAAMWARWHLVKAGMLEADSPRGVWEITDQGRERLARE